MRLYLIPDKTQGKLDYKIKTEKSIWSERNNDDGQSESCIRAKFIRKADNRLYLRIWNSGYEAAYNVRFFIPGEKRICVLKTRSYYPYLGCGKAFDEYVVADEAALSNVNVITLWEDECGNMFSNAQSGYINKINIC